MQLYNVPKVFWKGKWCTSTAHWYTKHAQKVTIYLHIYYCIKVITSNAYFKHGCQALYDLKSCQLTVLSCIRMLHMFMNYLSFEWVILSFYRSGSSVNCDCYCSWLLNCVFDYCHCSDYCYPSIETVGGHNYILPIFVIYDPSSHFFSY